MLALWLIIDLTALLLVAYTAKNLIKQASTPSKKFRAATTVLTIYSTLTLGICVYMMYDAGYTLFGALLFGGVIASVHIFLLSGFVIVNLSS